MQIRVIGIAPKNGNRYPIFKTNKVMTNERKNKYRKALENRFKTEFYLYYTHLDSQYDIPKGWIELAELPKYIVVDKQ